MLAIIIILSSLAYLVMGALTVAYTMRYLNWTYEWCPEEKVAAFFLWPLLVLAGLGILIGKLLLGSVNFMTVLGDRAMPRDDR